MDDTAKGADQDRHGSQPSGGTGVNVQRPVIVAILYLLNFVFSVSIFVGVVLAYVWRSGADTEEWEKSHYTYLIRTFWISFVLGFGTIILWFGTFFSQLPQQGGQSNPPDATFFIVIFGSLFVWMFIFAWVCVRCILSMMKAANRQPMPRPQTWLF